MSFGAGDLGVLGNLAKALGIFEADGSPNQGWFARPEDFLKNMLADPAQRDALIAFVDEAMGGAERSTEAGVVWLPVVELADPPMSVAVTVDESQPDGLHIGLGLRFSTTDPASATTLAVPLFRAHKNGGPSVSQPLLLGSAGGRIRIGTSITVDASPPVPGQARLGGIGIDVDLPTSPADTKGPVFGLALTGLQLPGAPSPRDVRVSADGADELDDALLDLVMSLLKAQADALTADPKLAALAGLLGLKNGDTVPDFPITELPTRGVLAIADWVRGLLAQTGPRSDWLGHLATLIGGARVGDTVEFDLGDATLTLGLRVDSGPSGNTRLTPTLGLELGNDDARVEARAELCRIDLVTGAAFALPSLGLWAAAGRAASPILDITSPMPARADTLRIGFALDSERRLNFVLAADGVTLGAHDYATLDLTSPDAVMDAALDTVGDIANQLLAGLGDSLGVVRQLIGLDAPAGITAVTLPALMADPLPTIGGYWQQLVGAPAAASTVLEALRRSLADASQAAATVLGDGTPGAPWRLPLIGPLQLELAASGSVLTLGVAGATSVDTLGQRCTVVETRLAATLARIDLTARSASLLPGVEATLKVRERGVNPSRARLVLGDGIDLTAEHVGLRLAWSPSSGLACAVSAPALTLNSSGVTLPVSLPVIAADGSVTLPAEAWDGVEALVGHLGGLIGGFLGDVVQALGWAAEVAQAGGDAGSTARLRLAQLVAAPEAALRDWLPRLAMSDLGARALSLMADLFAGSGGNRGVLRGTGHPDDPYRLALAEALPNIAIWFPPQGLEPVLFSAPEALRAWHPGAPGLSPQALQAALRAEAGVAADVRALVEGRDIEAGLVALTQRWAGGDGRIVAPLLPPAGIEIRRIGLAASQLLEQLDLEDLTGRVPTTTVCVAIGAGAWPEAPAGRLVDLSTAGLDAAMFAAPAAATGDWFVALGTRGDCRLGGSSTDGTPEQAARLARVLDALADVSSDIALVAVGGAGHAAREAAQAQEKVTDLVLLGTPLSAVSLTALSVQPTADALRLLDRLMPPRTEEADDEDLALGRALVQAMMDLTALADPAAELRPASVPPAAPRAGLAVTALFGEVSASQVGQALTAIVAAGLATRAHARNTPLPPPTGVHAGLRWVLPPNSTGTVAVEASARLQLFAFDLASGIDTSRVLRVQLRLGDRLGWLASSPDLELRAVSADLTLPLDGSAAGEARLVLHDARVFGQSWEALTLGNVPGAVPVLPEARVLLATAVQRLTADLTGTASLALSNLLAALGLTGANGGVVGDAVDQLIHDPAGLVRQRLASAGPAIAAAVDSLLGPLGASVDLPARSVRVQGGASTAGRFGWQADLSASPAALTGQLRIGPDAALPTVGGMQVQLDLAPLRVSLRWHHPGGRTDTVALWPAPDASGLARMLAQSAPSLAAHVALELMRRADASARPVIDAMLDALGLLSGAASDAERALRPLAGLLSDPAGWLRSAGSLAANPVKIQSLFDALRPLMELPGGNGTPLALADGVSLAVAADGPGARLTLQVDSSSWTAPNGVTARLSGGIGASLTVGLSGAPSVGLETFVGLDGGTPGRQAVYARVGNAGLEVFLRPATGADIRLLPFAGLGSLSDAAAAALPFLLDRLAEIAGTPGDLVRTVGDALALRKGAPTKKFDADALRAWAANPVGALTAAVPSIVSTGLATLAPLVDDFLPAGVSAAASSNQISITVEGVTLAWNPSAGRVSLSAPSIAVPGIQTLGATLAISAAGLDELSLAIGPAAIDAGGVMLRPFASFAAGLNPAGGRRVMVGLSANATQHFAARWTLDSAQFDLVASNGALATAVATADPAQVALRIVEVVADLVAAVAMAQQAVKDLLDTDVGNGGKDVRFLLQGVVLANVPNPTQLIAGVFNPATLLERVHRLFVNLAGASLSFDVADLRLSLKEVDDVVGLQVGVVDRFELLSGDVMLWLENDVRWISPRDNDDGGLFVGFLPTTLPLRFTPSLVVNGLGLRVGKSSGPLLDAGITLESIALHVYAAIEGSGAKSGGVQLQFANLAVSASGAQGENGIAQGIMRDTGPTPPKPAFSPALAIQAHNGGAVQVSLSAGDGTGPWWIAIQKGFGPLYLEQIGFGATMPQGRLERISLLMDGSVSMFGLTCAVDDLQITYIVGNNDFFNPASWAIDLAGLAVSADMAGVSLAGGLLKQTTPQGIEYLGMLLGRFAVYGLTVYGGYGEGESNGQKFTAFFAIGAVNGPIGGPPAFFLTGIGGGFGINRRLVVPTELSNFGDYPLIQALDIAATPSDPMTQLRALGSYFPMQKGTFWFAAGMSFNSFALVDGIAVVGVQVGDGLDINLLGLARMALPRPQVALVSIELALLVRFSSSEGVLWVQGQLTDNSWLLYQDIKLTGGFAYVIWFKGEKAGEFVLSMGGYHPDFHRDGYPVVPRLGLRWSIGDNIVIKAGSYFALTSEALMAGGDFEASAHFGPAWAEVKFGAHGIVFFDPFHYDVSAYARIAAGVTIDTWIFGEITISVSLGARIHVLGPEFRGSVTFEVGPIELTFEFGGSGQEQKQPISADAFIIKYLEAADSGKARPHALMTNTGALPAKGEDSTPDGSSSRPFVVVVEFSMTFTSTVPATRIHRTLAPAVVTTTTHAPSRAIGVGPMERSDVVPTIRLSWLRGGVAQPYPFIDTVRPFGRFPVGVWGPPQDTNNRQVPKAEMLEALSELDLVCRATPSGGGPEIPYYQVEINKRLPLPFTRSALDVATLRTLADDVTTLLAPAGDTATAFAAATKFLKSSATPTALAALRGERQAPPRLGTLTEGIETPTQTTIPEIAERPPAKVYDHFIDAPIAVGLLSGATVGIAVAPKARTTVKDSERAWRTAPPTLAGVEAQRSRSVAARLVLTDTPAQPTARNERIARSGTLVAAQSVPPTAVAHGATALVARAGAALAAPLADFNAALAVGQNLRAARAADAGAALAAGQTVVLKLPNAHADALPDGHRPKLAVAGAPARVVMLGHGGRRLADTLLGPGAATSTIEVPRGTERIVAIGQGAVPQASRIGLAGWHAGQQMPYAGHATAIGPGCVVHANGERLALHRERLDAGWVNGAELAHGTSTLSTTFAGTPRTVVVVLDDPASAGDNLDGRQLLLGLDGASRALDRAGREKPPVLLAMDNRSVLAYDIVPEGEAPVVVTIASQDGWSLVGVMASAELDATGAVALVSSRGLDAALQPFATTSATEVATPSRLAWIGPTRSRDERTTAKARAQGGVAVAALLRRQAARMTAPATDRTKPGKTGGRR